MCHFLPPLCHYLNPLDQTIVPRLAPIELISVSNAMPNEEMTKSSID